MRLALRLLLLAATPLTAPLAAEPVEVHGRVLGPDRQPVAGAQVALRPLIREFDRATAELAGKLEARPVRESASDSDGTFTLQTPEPGMWRLSVSARGFVPLEHDLVPLVEAESLVEARLARDAGLEVRVADVAGRPLDGAWVEAVSETAAFYRDGWRTAARRGRADGQGVVRLPRASGEELEVRAFAPGLAEATAIVRRSQVALRLAAGPRRTLRVQSAAGAPSAGAIVLGGRGRWPLGRTGADGKLSFALPDPRSPLAVAAADAAVVTQPWPPGGERENEPAVLKLPPAHTLAGRVVDARTRRPVPDALVWSPAEPARPARAGGDGSYRLAGWSAEAVSAQAARYLQQLGSAPRSGGDVSLTFALEAAAHLAGTVADEGGAPVTGAEITVAVDLQRSPPHRRFGRAWPSAERSRSGPDGRFVLRGLAPELAYDLRVARSGYAALTRELDPLEQSPATPLRLVLRRGAGARVRVVDSRQNPIAGAAASLRPAEDDTSFSRFFGGEPVVAHEATTDTAGVAVFGNLPAGRYDLEIEARGYGPSTVPGVRIPESGASDLGTVNLEPGVAVEGRVVDGAGAPLGDVAMWVLDAAAAMDVGFADPEGEADAFSAADGHFRVADRRPGERLHVLAYRAGFAPGEAPGVRAPTERPLRIVLHPRSSVSGRIVDEDEKPVAHAPVVWQLQRSGQDASWMAAGESVAADGDGRFLLRDVLPGSIALHVHAPGFQPAELDDLEIPPGKDVEGLEIVLHRGAAVAGRVLDSEGEPEVGALVEVAPQRGAAAMQVFIANPSDGDGRYRLEGVEPGRRAIAATADDGRSAVAELDVALGGENTLDLRLEGGVEVAGTVVDSGGAPVSGATVTFIKPGTLRGFRHAGSGGDGAFLFKGMTDGDYTVTAGRPGYPRAQLEQPVKVQGAPISGLEIRLPAAGAITGELRGLEFRELAEVRVWGTNRSGGGGASARQDHSGRYRLENAAPGDWVVRATVESSGRQAEGRVQLEPGQEEAVLDLDFGEGLTLAGHVLRRGEPVGGAWVLVEGLELASRGEAATDHDGAFRIEGLKAGSYVLRVTLGGFRGASGAAHRQELRLEEDRDITVELAGGEIAGRVVDSAERTPLPGATLTLEPVERLGSYSYQDRRVATSDTRGGFRLTELAGGTFRMRVEREGYASAEREIGLAEGGREEVEIELQATEGLTLRVAFAAGGQPAGVRVALLDTAGRSIGGGAFDAGPGGEVRVTTAPRGSWEALVVGESSAVARVPVVVPGPPVTVVLEPGATLEVSVPTLAASDQLARLTAVDGWGRIHQLPLGDGSLRQEAMLTYGKGRLRYLPAGSWRLVATDAAGQSYSATVQVVPGSILEVTLE